MVESMVGIGSLGCHVLVVMAVMVVMVEMQVA
jgi:hypothetical protein